MQSSNSYFKIETQSSNITLASLFLSDRGSSKKFSVSFCNDSAFSSWEWTSNFCSNLFRIQTQAELLFNVFSILQSNLVFKGHRKCNFYLLNMLNPSYRPIFYIISLSHFHSSLGVLQVWCLYANVHISIHEESPNIPGTNWSIACGLNKRFKQVEQKLPKLFRKLLFLKFISFT